MFFKVVTVDIKHGVDKEPIHWGVASNRDDSMMTEPGSSDLCVVFLHNAISTLIY